MPWDKAIAGRLDELGVELVEDLKLLTPEHVKILFPSAKFVVKRRADLAWRELGGKNDFVFEPVETPIVLESPSPEPPSKKAKVETNRWAKHCRWEAFGSSLF